MKAAAATVVALAALIPAAGASAGRPLTITKANIGEYAGK